MCEEASQQKRVATKGFFSALPRFLLFPGNRGAQKIEEILERAIQEDHSATYAESFAVSSSTPQAGTTVQRHLAKGVASNKGVTSDNPNKAPILDTGATRCLLHLSWMSKDVIEKAERIHLGVANGTRSRALFWNNVMYSPVTARPLISVGQLKVMLD